MSLGFNNQDEYSKVIYSLMLLVKVSLLLCMFFFEKYKDLVDRLKKSYDDVIYANISMSACGFIEKDSKKFLDIMTKLTIPETEIQYLTKSIINICIRISYFIFCRRNKEWTEPDLLSF